MLPPDAHLLPVVLLRPEPDRNLQRLLAHSKNRGLRARLCQLVRQPGRTVLREHHLPPALQAAAVLRLDGRPERRVWITLFRTHDRRDAQLGLEPAERADREDLQFAERRRCRGSPDRRSKHHPLLSF